MKYLILLILCGVTNFLYAQDISMEYLRKDGVTIKGLKITKETKIVTISGVNSLKQFTLTVTNLPANNKLHILDDIQSPIGTITVNSSVVINTEDAINNKIIKIIQEDDKGVKSLFARVIIQDIPKSKFTMIAKIAALTSFSKNACESCDFDGNALIYNYAKNSISYKNNKYRWSFGRPIVGHPYSFTVKNINPFRDSVVISNETIDFNTEVPELFNKAFFSPSLQEKHKNQNEILSDVFELGEEIKKIKSELKDSKECTDICSIIQKVKDETEKHFSDSYGFDNTKTVLVDFIFANLEDIDVIYKDSVTTILNDYRNFYNTRNYFNYNIPQIQNADQYIFTLSILPKYGANSYTIVDHQPITVNTVGGIKVDFSSGLFVTKLRDERYNLNSDSSVIRNSYGGDSIVFNRRNQIVQQTDDKKSDFGVAALMHFYPRISSFVNIALSLGAGVSIGPNPAIRYLGGGSLLLGKSARLGFTYGWAGGFVDVLANGYQNQQYISISDPKAITKKSFKTDQFFAVTFNIPLFKSKVKVEDTKKEDPAPATKDDSKEETASKEEK